MSPDMQELESFFKKIQKTTDTPSNPEPITGDPVDFNGFFEKLSSLDDLNWTDAPPPDAYEQTGEFSSGKSKGKIRKSKTPAFTAPNQKMRVLRNDHPLISAGKSQPEADSWKNFNFERLADPTESGLVSKLKSIGKFTMLAALLFVLGLGAGWMALSIPTRFKDSNNIESNSRVEKLIAQSEKSQQNPTMEEITKEVGLGENIKVLSGKPASGNNHSNQSGMDGLIITENGKKPGVAHSKMPIVIQNTPAQPKMVVKTASKNRPVKSDKIANTSIGRFSLQVGACNSTTCVDSYRKILLTQVKSDQIHIIQVNKRSGLVQRIRVEPLSRREAQGLKGKLAQTDPRFKDSYLVALR